MCKDNTAVGNAHSEWAELQLVPNSSGDTTFFVVENAGVYSRSLGSLKCVISVQSSTVKSVAHALGDALPSVTQFYVNNSVNSVSRVLLFAWINSKALINNQAFAY